MQVSSVSNQNFSGKRDNINRFITMDDSDIRRYAIVKASEKNEKRVKKANRLYYSVPLVAAISAAALTRGRTTTFFKNKMTGKAANLANAIKEGGYWTFLLGTAAVGAAASNKLENKSNGYRNFRQNHPLLALTGDLAGFLAVTAIVPRACNKVLGKLGPKTLGAINKGINGAAKKVNELKMPKFVKNIGEKISKLVPNKIKTWKANAVMPEALKSTAKSVVKYAPHITLLSAFFASLNNRAKFMNDVENTYSQVRDKQQRLVRARLAELEAQH